MNFLLAGVGGQGVVLAARVLAAALLECGQDVKQSEVHGMAQRGGSVVCYVKSGSKVYSPLIEYGEADVLVAFEQLECLRYLHFLRPNGAIVMSTVKLVPLSVSVGKAIYPEDPAAVARSRGSLLTLDPVKIAEESGGSARMANLVMVGAVAGKVGLPIARCTEAIKASVSSSLRENLRAFEAGYEAGASGATALP